MKPRELRTKVIIKAHMRVGSAWHDTCILDLSSRGLMIQSSDPPPGGSYLELRRGRHVIIARVMWSHGRLSGLRAQDVLSTQAIIAEPDQSAGSLIVSGQERRDVRLVRASPARVHEQSRWHSRAWEFASLALVGTALATFAYGAVAKALNQPLAAVEVALAGK